MVARNLSFITLMLVLTKTSEEETNGTAIQFLEATSVLGTFSFIPGIDYSIINATLLVDKKSPSLTIYGERPPTEHY